MKNQRSKELWHRPLSAKMKNQRSKELWFCYNSSLAIARRTGSGCSRYVLLNSRRILSQSSRIAKRRGDCRDGEGGKVGQGTARNAQRATRRG